MVKKVALVACVKTKRSMPMLAEELYCSSWFLKASAYAKSIADEWYILSAKYGLVSPHKIIAPYNQTLNGMSASTRRAWAKCVMDDLSKVLQPGDKVIILASEKYRANLVSSIRALECSVEIPMDGLRLGEQKRWLKQRLEDFDAK